MTNKFHLLVCPFFLNEVKTALRLENYENVSVSAYPVKCQGKKLDIDDINKALPAKNQNSQVIILGSYCLRGLKKLSGKKHNYQIYLLDQCFSLFIDQTELNAYLNKKFHLLTPGWLKGWRTRLKEWGFGDEKGRDILPQFFGESSNKLVLLDTGTYQESSSDLKEFSEQVNMPFEIRKVGLDIFRLYIIKIFLKWQLENERVSHKTALNNCVKESADYAMVIDVFGQMSEILDEKEAIERYFTLFSILFAPKEMFYLSIDNGEYQPIYSYKKAPANKKPIENRLKKFKKEYDWTENGKGFIINIYSKKKSIGVLEVNDLLFPEFKEHYLGLSLSFLGAFVLSIENIRKYHKLLDQKKALVQTLDELKTTQQHLFQAQKMEAIGTLAGGVAHDFNNILGIIVGYTDLTINDPGNAKEVVNNLLHVMKASKRARDMVNQILEFSRKNEESMEAVNVRKVINEIIIFLRSSIPSTIKIETNLEKNPGMALGNATQINQVLMNLCANAAFAMRDNGGTLKITLKRVIVNTELSISTGIKPGINLLLSVGDSGTGIRSEIMDRIFEPFFTTKKQGEGTGMGLAVIYGIVKSHKGEIKVDSKPGEGTTFNIYFPVLDKFEPKELQTDTPPPLTGNNEKILFVDDELDIAKLGLKILKTLGYSVDARASSVEALEVFKADPDKFDILVSDMTMPNLTGVKLAEEIHKIRPDLPAVICTGYSDSIDRDNYKSFGIDALVLKPLTKDELAETIREVLDKKND